MVVYRLIGVAVLLVGCWFLTVVITDVVLTMQAEREAEQARKDLAAKMKLKGGA